VGITDKCRSAGASALHSKDGGHISMYRIRTGAPAIYSRRTGASAINRKYGVTFLSMYRRRTGAFATYSRRTGASAIHSTGASVIHINYGGHVYIYYVFGRGMVKPGVFKSLYFDEIFFKLLPRLL